MADLVRHVVASLGQKLKRRSRDKPAADADNHSWKTRRFQFQELDYKAQQIRLLRLLPMESGTETNHIACELRPFDFAETPPFSALSWAWGNNLHDIAQDICVNDAAFRISNPRLLDALHHLCRYLAQSTSTTGVPDWVWIDTLCINQQHQEERGHQVQMMASVYGRARKVISWLGSGDSAITSAFSFIAETVEAAKNSAKSQAQAGMLLGPESAPSAPPGASKDSTSSMGTTIVDPRLIHLFSLSNDIPKFFGMEYWHRLWIVQELVRSQPEHNIIMYGNDTMLFSDIQIFRDSWLEFLKRLQLLPQWVASLARTPGWEDIAASWPAYVHSMEDTLVVWSYYDFLRGISTSGDNLFYIVLAGAYISVDPRDKVFGFLGLASPTAQEQVHVDYSDAVENVYENWFIKVLMDWGSLEPLYFAGLASSTHIRPMEKLPSWVPDLRRSIRASPVWDATLERTLTAQAEKDLRFRFSALRTSLPCILGRHELRCDGVLAGQAASVFPIEYATGSLNLVPISDALSAASGDGVLPALSFLRSVFWALMCGVDRFNAAEAARRVNSAEWAVTQPEMSITHVGSEQFQLVRSMPIMQAVAKLVLQRGGGVLATGDSVLAALCVDSRRLGTNNVADMLLMLAFIRVYLSSATTQDIFALTSQLGPHDVKSPGGLNNILHLFLDGLGATQGAQGRVAPDFCDSGLSIERLLSSDAIPVMEQTLVRYLEAYEHTLFVTSDGMLGNGPRAMRMGDKVVLLDGVQMPFVVRPCARGHQLIGPCYVQGISNGEPAAAARRGELEPVEIVLV
ncbi:heterokaryon incompatibility protein-domain-containing protein [Podospora aff. communis PSN243]|uniref:Heterokaryon incompatibility protein-domain-containing protein n=1 Tax=Podospora aff. communis PSN243 TaxID=3040156 RepID=A0AAV9H5R5_9PEZI|nr:heterokaryon incompatibility protein-domain-containing protein [Podospora aff. communis PSN243]